MASEIIWRGRADSQEEPAPVCILWHYWRRIISTKKHTYPAVLSVISERREGVGGLSGVLGSIRSYFYLTNGDIERNTPN